MLLYRWSQVCYTQMQVVVNRSGEEGAFTFVPVKARNTMSERPETYEEVLRSVKKWTVEWRLALIQEILRSLWPPEKKEVEEPKDISPVERGLLSPSQKPLSQFFRESPLAEVELDIRRDKSPIREEFPFS